MSGTPRRDARGRFAAKPRAAEGRSAEGAWFDVAYLEAMLGVPVYQSPAFDKLYRALRRPPDDW